MTELLLLVVVGLAVMATVLWLGRRSALRTAAGAEADIAGLRARITELEHARARGTEILERMEEGVLVFSEVLLPVVANRSARRMLGVRGESLPPRLPSEGVLSVARRALVDDSP